MGGGIVTCEIHWLAFGGLFRTSVYHGGIVRKGSDSFCKNKWEMF